MSDDDRDEPERTEPEGDEEETSEARQESNPGEVQSYERAREVREEPDAPEGVAMGAGGPAEERGDRIPPAQAGDESERGEPIGSATAQRAAATVEEAKEPVTEPDEPVEKAQTAAEVGSVPDSVATTHEAEGLTTLEEAVEAESGGGGQGRLAELMEKRKQIGLTDADAEELGRLVAESEGQSHTSAQSSRQEGRSS
jgi:hypothetical protein